MQRLGLLLLWLYALVVSVVAFNIHNGPFFLTQRVSFARGMGANNNNGPTEISDASTNTFTSPAETVSPLMQSQPSAEQLPMPTLSTTTKTKSPESLIRVLSTPAEFFDTIAMSSPSSSSSSDSKSKNFLVVNYHASYCKQCHRTSPALKKLANPYQDDFDFARVEAKVLGSDALKKLGIMTFPFFQIYYQGWCVASFSTGSGPVYAFEKLVSTTLDQCRLRIRSPEAWQSFFQQFEIPIRDTHRAIEELRPILLLSNDKEL